MAVLIEDHLQRSPFWIAVCSIRSGEKTRRIWRTTKIPVRARKGIDLRPDGSLLSPTELRARAAEVANGIERVLWMEREGSVTESALRDLVSDVLERTEGKKLINYSVHAWLTEWIDSRRATISERSLVKYRQVLDDFIRFLGKRRDARLETISPADFIRFRDELLEEGRTPQTVNQLVRKVLAMPFILAWKQGHIRSNPISSLPPLRTDQIEKGTFTIEEISKLLSGASLDWKGVILVAYYTGARLKDACKLRWENIDLANGLIRFVVGKTQKVLVVAIHPQLHEHLIYISGLDDPNASLFPTLAGKSGTGKSGLSAQFKRLMEKAGVGAGIVRGRKGKAGRSLSLRSFHSLRHSFNSAMANAGVPQEIRRKLVGHASDVMNSRYTHHEIETLRKAISSVPRLAGG